MPDDLRPSWDGYIGQTKLKDRLQIHIHAALDRQEQLDHILLVGPPGCGKTTLAGLIATEADMYFVSYVMPLKPRLIKRLVQNYEGLALFDEIHRLPAREQENLLTLIQDGYLQLDNGQRIENTALTIVGATTEPAKILKPLWDRFPIKPIFEDYTDDQMGQIVQGMAVRMGFEIPIEIATILGRAAGGIPRVAQTFVGMARDLGNSNPRVVFEKCGVTEDGLDRNHLRYLQFLTGSGGMAGLDLISTHLGLPKSVVSDLERLLVRQGYIQYTSTGRDAEQKAYKLAKQGMT